MGEIHVFESLHAFYMAAGVFFTAAVRLLMQKVMSYCNYSDE